MYPYIYIYMYILDTGYNLTSLVMYCGCEHVTNWLDLDLDDS